MNEAIIKECGELNRFATGLTAKADGRLNGLLHVRPAERPSAPSNKTASHVSNPERPWMLGGAASIVCGVVAIAASNSAWGYLLGAAGIGALCVGAKKKNDSADKGDDKVSSRGTSSVDGSEIADKVMEITKEIESEWTRRVEEAKGTVQREITKSAVGEEVKQSLMEDTYVTERVNLDVNGTMDALYAANDIVSITGIVKSYLRSVDTTVKEAAQKQTSIYETIAKKL